jgi:hypothetical protein
MSPLPPDWEVLLHESGFLLAVWRKKVAFQLRRAPISLEHVQRSLPRIHHFARSGRPFGIVLVLAPGAPLPPEPVRAEQRQFLQVLARNPLGRIALVQQGDDVQAGLLRSVSRMTALQFQNLRSFSEVPPALSWLASQMTPLGLPLDDTELGLAFDTFARYAEGILPCSVLIYASSCMNA